MHAPRPVGTAERFYWLFDRVSCTNFVVVAELVRPIDPGALAEALGEARQAYPLLDARIGLDEKGQVILEPGLAPAERSRVDVRAVDGDGAAGVATQLSEPFPWGSHPLHRFALHRRADSSERLVATFHHALLDARSGLWLVERILARALCGEALGSAPALPPCQESLYPARWKGVRARLGALGMVLRGRLESMGSVQIPIEGQGPRRPLVLSLALDPPASAAWLERARREGTTVHGGLCAAQLIALRAEIEEQGSRKLSLYHPVDLRPSFEPALETSAPGMFISMVPTSHQLGPEIDLWGLAREIRARVVCAVERGDAHLAWTGSPPMWIFPPDERGARREQKMMDLLPPMTVVSNVGRVGAPSAALLQAVRGLHFAMGPQTGCPLLSAVTTWGGTLRVNLCFDRERVSPVRAERIRARIGAMLLP